MCRVCTRPRHRQREWNMLTTRNIGMGHSHHHPCCIAGDCRYTFNISIVAGYLVWRFVLRKKRSPLEE